MRLTESERWLPDSSAIAFSTVLSGVRLGAGYHGDLWVVDADTGAVRRIMPDGTAGHVVPSPDSLWLAVTSADYGGERPASVTLIRPDGSDSRQVMTYGRCYTDTDWPQHADPKWRPDGQSFLIAVPAHVEIPTTAPVGPLPPQEWLLYEVPVDGDATPFGLSAKVTATCQGVYGAGWSPDRSLIAITEQTAKARAMADAHDPQTHAEALALQPAQELFIGAADASDLVSYAAAPGLQFGGWVPRSNEFQFRTFEAYYRGELGKPPTRLPGELMDCGGITTIDREHWLCTTGWDPRVLSLIAADGRSHTISGDVAAYDVVAEGP